jgi:phospholipase/carboxylesterase
VVICHGYGAPGEDLVPFAPHWIELLGDAAAPFRFIFPAAPHSLADLGMPAGRAWWPINMQQLMEQVAAGHFTELHQHEPPGIADARALLVEAITAILEALDASPSQMVLGGFSQGAMLTMDTALRGLAAPPAMLLQMSGMLVCQPNWEPQAAKLRATRVIQSHGRQDFILPFASGEALRDMLIAAGVDVEFLPFDGPHTVNLEMLGQVAVALRELVPPQ